MATSPLFGWEEPDDTDLVKDGAAAIRTLGNAIDTSMGDLLGGTTGQVLSKNSNTNMDFTWVTSDDANAIQNAIVDAKGDLITATAADTPARLAVGTNGQTLVADSTASTGLAWSTPTSGGMTLLETITLSTTSHTSASISQSYVNIMVLIKDLTASASATIMFRFNGNTSGYYGYSGVNATFTAISNQNYLTTGDNTSTNGNGNYMINIPNYTDASGTNKLIQWVGANNSTGAILSGAGNWANGTAAVTTFTISTVAGTANLGGTMYIYGVK